MKFKLRYPKSCTNPSLQPTLIRLIFVLVIVSDKENHAMLCQNTILKGGMLAYFVVEPGSDHFIKLKTSHAMKKS